MHDPWPKVSFLKAVGHFCYFQPIVAPIIFTAIAWDGSPTLARALTAARVFLGKSLQIILITATDDKAIETNNRDQYATILRQSGFHVDVISAQSNGVSPAITLQAVAKENGANLLVAGGYGHSRFREFILGGVTRSLLGNLDMPVLLPH
ncbi:universal stress protein [Agrobacterium tumefaciens]